MHTPVFLDEVITLLDVKSEQHVIDATYGEGGHAREIAKLTKYVLALDIDERAVQDGKEEARKDGIKLVNANFRNIDTIARTSGYVPADRILFDFGLSMSSYQKSGKGLSYVQVQEPLDMRLDKNISESAQSIVIHSTRERLYEIFARYSQDINSRAIAESIVRSRRINPIETVGDLNKIIKETVGEGGFEPTARRIYQALYMHVNDEVAAIEEGIGKALSILIPGGRIVTIGFHEGHERAIKKSARMAHLKARKYEIARPLRSYERSATLRVIEKNS